MLESNGISFTMYDNDNVKIVKLAIIPSVIPRGFDFPPVEDDDKMTGSNGQMQGAKIVIIPEINAKSSNIGIR
jgi:hypothetical protein